MEGDLTMPQRIFDGAFAHGELYVFPNRLAGVGAECGLHGHEFPHMALFYPGKDGEARYEVYAEKPDGTEVLLELDAWGFCYIAAGVRHRIRLVAGTEGRFACIFSRYGANGEYRVDPLIDHKPCIEEQG